MTLHYATSNSELVFTRGQYGFFVKVFSFGFEYFPANTKDFKFEQFSLKVMLVFKGHGFVTGFGYTS